MKATIENSFVLNGLTKSGDLTPLLLEFNRLLIVITIAKDEKMLRDFMNKEFNKSKFFKFGFGGSHMWVNQINENNRLLIVYF